MVSAALKPFYNEQIISRDEYTNVNRDTCHKLYDKIGDFEALDVEGKARWEKVAGEEVTKAVGALKGTAIVSSGLWLHLANQCQQRYHEATAFRVALSWLFFW
jgi:hypothetical protein